LLITEAKENIIMLHFIPTLKRSIVVSSVIVLSGGLTPMAAFADSGTTTTCAIPQSTAAGVHQPVGADASTYTYNCDTGMWENAHYTYNPTTGVVTPKDAVVYTYDTATGKYDTTVWTYDAPKGNYDPITESVVLPPVGANVVGGPVVVAAIPTAGNSGGNSISNTGPGSTNTINNDGGVTDGSSISGTGPNSTNTINGSNTNGLTENNQNNASFNNILNAQANTGNASVLGNTNGGSATTGDAQDIANVVNMLQSTSNALSGNTVTFVANINGDVNGDLMLDPSTLGSIQPASATGQNNLTLNNDTTAGITNNVDLNAQSGDATVADNTNGGDATTGSAQAIANVVNVINSAINAGKSFVGVININGNLNGDILMPQNFLDQLIASNVPTVSIDTTGPSSTNTITGTNNNNTTVNNTNNLGATNNVTGTATTGSATVANNTAAGNATSGNASNTSITAFNLTGSDVIGSNDLLVFVNVSGTWVGMIMDAPAGATAAELGGGITTDTADGSNNDTVNNTNNDSINNNINLNAASGNASVTGNTTGGNAKSGDAKTAANLLNVENSKLTLANWFGVLFINVFGNWNGSFGINTSAGDPVITPAIASSTGGTTTQVASPVRIFRFVANNNGSVTPVAANGSTSNIPKTTEGAVLAANITKTPTGTPTPQLQAAHRSYWLPITAIVLFVIYIIGDRIYTLRTNGSKK
jgi:hypothetical protein